MWGVKMRRYVPLFLLSASLTLSAQVVVTSNGQATLGGPGITPAQSLSSQPQSIVPANIALPGSGAATGLPPDVTVNNSAKGGEGSVFQPIQAVGTVSATEAVSGAGNTLGVTSGNTSGVTSNMSSSMTSSAGLRPLNLGIQNFAGAQPVDARSVISLGEVARLNKTRNAQQAKTFTNETLGVPRTADQPQASNASGEFSNGRATPANVVLDQNDLAKVEAALQRHDGAAQNEEVAGASPTANPAAEYARISSEAESAAPSTQAENVPSKEGRGGLDERLPASSSALPLLALLGFAAFSGGIAYRYGRR